MVRKYFRDQTKDNKNGLHSLSHNFSEIVDRVTLTLKRDVTQTQVCLEMFTLLLW